MRSRMYSRSQSVWLFPIWLSDECRDGCEKLNKRHNPSNIVNKSCTSTICQRPPRGGLSALGASKTDPRFCCGALVANGTSRHSPRRTTLVAIGCIADKVGLWRALDMTRLTPLRHWLCTAATFLIRVSAPINVLD